jgi:oligoribonuclease
MNDFVRNMHTASGLINEFDNGLELAEAEQVVLDYVKRFVPNPKDAPLAGNTIGTDRMFLNRYMPNLDQHLHYRNIDVSSIKELSRRWFPRVYFQMPKKSGNHRALADIMESITELKYYREAVFVPLPGPTSEEAQAAAVKASQN